MHRNTPAIPAALALAAVAALTALSAAAPHAAAQGAPAELWALSVSVDPVPGPLHHQGSQVAPVTVSAPCEAALAKPGGQPVDLAVTLAPPWVVALLEPAQVQLTTGTCVDGVATARAALRVQATEHAPPGRHAALEVTAQAPGLTEARNHTHVVAQFWGHARVVADRTAAVAPAGVAAHFPITVENGANGAVRVHLAVAEAYEGAHVRVPAPFTVPALAEGTPDDARTVQVSAKAPHRSGYTWAHERVALEATIVRATDPGHVVGAETLLLHVATDGAYVAAPVVVGAVALLGGAGWAGLLHYRRKRAR